MTKAEQAKLDKDGLDVWADLHRYAAAGDIAAVTADDLNRLKWFGLYHDRPKTGHFMLRVRLPGGILTADQADVIAELAETLAPGRLELTTRQTFQLHTLALSDVPAVFSRLQSVGLQTVETCGDVPRNVVASPVADLAADAWLDPTPFVLALDDHFSWNRDYTNLPRKYKVTVASGGTDATQAPINDLAFIPARAADGTLGFNVWVGGGLSHEPHLAVALDLFVPADAEQVVAVAAAVTRTFRDHGFREKRNHARLKYLIADWGAERFRAEVEQSLGSTQPRAAADESQAPYTGDVLGVHPQRQTGLSWVGLLVPTGRLDATQLRELARLSRRYGRSELRLTLNQNLVLPHIPTDDLPTLLAEPILSELRPEAPSLQRHVVACTGLPYCNFATIETKERAWTLAGELDGLIPLDVPIRTHLSACPHGCSQHSVADIGLQGGVVRAKDRSGTVPAADILLGGALGSRPALARRVATKVPFSELTSRLAGLLQAYQDERTEPTEPFSDWVARQTDDGLRTRLGFEPEPVTDGVWSEEGSWNQTAKGGG